MACPIVPMPRNAIDSFAEPSLSPLDVGHRATGYSSAEHALGAPIKGKGQTFMVSGTTETNSLETIHCGERALSVGAVGPFLATLPTITCGFVQE